MGNCEKKPWLIIKSENREIFFGQNKIETTPNTKKNNSQSTAYKKTTIALELGFTQYRKRESQSRESPTKLDDLLPEKNPNFWRGTPDLGGVCFLF